MCSEVQGEWSDSGNDFDYVEIVSFPLYARNLEISEFGSPDNYLALVGDSSGQGYINWDREIQQPGRHVVHGGTELVYRKDEHNQTISIKDPLTEPVIAFLFRFHAGSQVSWKYTIPYTNATYQVSYSWSMSDWSVCNVTCGGGIQQSIPRCTKDSDPGSLFDPLACDVKEKPQDITRPCGTATCPPTWWTGPWQRCPDPCHGLRHRTVLCSNSNNQALIDSTCSENQRPASVDRCSESKECKRERENPKTEIKESELGEIQPGFLLPQVTTDMVDEIDDQDEIIEIDFSNIVLQDWNEDDVYEDNWIIGNWSACSMPCGSGISYRSVTCVKNCSKYSQPPTVMSCNLGPCSDWIVGYWSDCDTQCGEGVKTRTVSCSGVCDSGTRPEDTVACMEGECSVWTAGPWTSCNTQCGTGSRHRLVSCIHAVTEVPMQDCREEERPAGEEECSSECKEEGRKEEVRGKSMRRCQDVLDSISCQKYSVYCGVRISFTKRCCNTCFQRFKLRQGI